ncbi:hypothetical protein CC1G_04069 [Coprinopsis cinerea okayama7|uniref:TEA domain-containing protein n=1 Tax=Coprinopsis cinerea (strain Okayama-7 / 130 / ATCC MYA-4618 / FGSC 9003) TaxID=240176 RepID=A8NVU4_COPC7|nr:hypothetical protein CC1G_04069 [Coprinopsis cinerea okayama7\|eukprot:XP_001836756.1 hypothetical protein CC1G_04069 [Coprinopsis cinerea okayama7\
MSQLTGVAGVHFTQTTPLCDLGTSPTRHLPTESSMGKTGRKTYKTDKTKKEAIWPDYLESWLLQGIAMYTPPASRSGRGRNQLQRFPRRNKLISEFILQNTGKIRTPKQVGSRIQQLRATCRDPIIRRELTDLTRFSHDDHSDTDEDRTPPPSVAKSRSPLSDRSLDSIDLKSDCSDVTLLNREIEELVLSPATPNHLLSAVSHLVWLTIYVCDDEWRHVPNQPRPVCLDLPAAPLRALEDVKDSRISVICSIPRSQVLRAPPFTITSDALDRTRVYHNTFEIFDNHGPVGTYSCTMRASNSGEFSADFPSDIWQNMANDTFLQHNYSFVQHITPLGDEAFSSMIVKYSVAFQYAQSAVYSAAGTYNPPFEPSTPTSSLVHEHPAYQTTYTVDPLFEANAGALSELMSSPLAYESPSASAQSYHLVSDFDSVANYNNWPVSSTSSYSLQYPNSSSYSA